jgi:hypothetical protein
MHARVAGNFAHKFINFVRKFLESGKTSELVCCRFNLTICVQTRTHTHIYSHCRWLIIIAESAICDLHFSFICGSCFFLLVWACLCLYFSIISTSLHHLFHHLPNQNHHFNHSLRPLAKMVCLKKPFISLKDRLKRFRIPHLRSRACKAQIVIVSKHSWGVMNT